MNGTSFTVKSSLRYINRILGFILSGIRSTDVYREYLRKIPCIIYKCAIAKVSSDINDRIKTGITVAISRIAEITRDKIILVIYLQYIYKGWTK